MWGATPRSGKLRGFVFYFNPRTPCGVRPPRQHRKIRGWWNFNPRTPCGVRLAANVVELARFRFQSTHPVWGATGHDAARPLRRHISIHAPRVGCDTWHPTTPEAGTNFNPRTPCGVRLAGKWGNGTDRKFQSTHPVWGATKLTDGSTVDQQFQSTHPVWGATPSCFLLSRCFTYFNPRTPCGVRLRPPSWR